MEPARCGGSPLGARGCTLGSVTGPYDWFPMPHVLDVRCPRCRGCARFEHVELVRIARKDDLPFFRGSSLFEVRFMRSRHAGQSFWAALYFAGLHGPPTSTIHDLPQGYEPSQWAHGKYWYRTHALDLGSLFCACGHRARHTLAWPTEAFFQIEHRREVLWAYHREHAAALRDYIAGTDRKPKRAKLGKLMMHLPAPFLEARSRGPIVRKLDEILAP